MFRSSKQTSGTPPPSRLHCLTHGCSGIVHLAARKAVGESIKHPLHYWHVNVERFRSLLAAAVEAQVAHVVLSSSAACYGTPSVDNVTEDVIGAPLSPYGSTKLACEVMLGEVAEAYGLRHTSLRYLNVAGAGCPELGDTGVFNLIPMVSADWTPGSSRRSSVTTTRP